MKSDGSVSATRPRYTKTPPIKTNQNTKQKHAMSPALMLRKDITENATFCVNAANTLLERRQRKECEQAPAQKAIYDQEDTGI
jgi:hypothetical protein